jgi:hypothetical protein
MQIGPTTISWRIAAIRGALGLTMLLAATRPPHAASPEACQTYASQATSQQTINQTRACGFAGDRWSDNWGGHFNWCLGASDEQLQAENGARESELNRCGACWRYAAEATDLQQRNVNSQCGYAGDPWSFDTGNHFRWCLSADQASIDRETGFRRAEIGKCDGCRAYAARAVDAFNVTRICGYGGDRWNPDFGAHFRWCTIVSAADSNSEDAARQADVGRCRLCQGYAQAAVQAQEQNLARACGFVGDAWSADSGGHLRWCLGARPDQIQLEGQGRNALLFRCGDCQPYVVDAIRAQQENIRRGCGLVGDRWSETPGHHAAWCAIVGDGAARAETAARRMLLVQCLVPGKRQACDAYAATAVAQQAESGRLGCGFTGDAWSSNRQNHYAWCLGVNASVFNAETAARERDLAGCRRAMGRPAPAECTLSVVIRTGACANVDGSRSEYLEPGSTSATGCSTEEDAAENAAKLALASQVALSEGDEPAPGTCTYEREATFAGCLCSR